MVLPVLWLALGRVPNPVSENIVTICVAYCAAEAVTRVGRASLEATLHPAGVATTEDLGIRWVVVGVVDDGEIIRSVRRGEDGPALPVADP